MLYQIDKYTAMLTGVLAADPVDDVDRNGDRITRLSVAYGAARDRDNNGFVRLELPVIVSGYFTSYARRGRKGDSVFAVGHKPLKPNGEKVNTMLISRYRFGYINISGTLRAFEEEQEVFTRSKVAKEAKKRKQKQESEDYFGEIKGEWY